MIVKSVNRPAMPPKPYRYAVYQHNNKRVVPMLGDVLLAWRKQNKITQQQLCSMCEVIARASSIDAHVTQADISNYENRVCQPKIDKLTLISLATSLTIEQLTGYTSSMTITSSALQKKLHTKAA